MSVVERLETDTDFIFRELTKLKETSSKLEELEGLILSSIEDLKELRPTHVPEPAAAPAPVPEPVPETGLDRIIKTLKDADILEATFNPAEYGEEELLLILAEGQYQQAKQLRREMTFDSAEIGTLKIKELIMPPTEMVLPGGVVSMSKFMPSFKFGASIAPGKLGPNTPVEQDISQKNLFNLNGDNIADDTTHVFHLIRSFVSLEENATLFDIRLKLFTKLRNRGMTLDEQKTELTAVIKSIAEKEKTTKNAGVVVLNKLGVPPAADLTRDSIIDTLATELADTEKAQLEKSGIITLLTDELYHLIPVKGLLYVMYEAGSCGARPATSYNWPPSSKCAYTEKLFQMIELSKSQKGVPEPKAGAEIESVGAPEPKAGAEIESVGAPEPEAEAEIESVGAPEPEAAPDAEIESTAEPAPLPRRAADGTTLGGYEYP